MQCPVLASVYVDVVEKFISCWPETGWLLHAILSQLGLHGDCINWIVVVEYINGQELCGSR